MVELILLIIEAFTRGKREESQGQTMHRHTIEPGTDLEGARPKVDRYGLDHAVPVTVYDVGPDALIQPARVRAGDKRRQIEQRLEAEALARETAAEPESHRMDLPPVEELTDQTEPVESDEATAYPYQFQDQARVTHRVVRPPAHPVAVVAKTEPIVHPNLAGRQRRHKPSAVSRLLTQPKTLVQLVQAKAVLEPPLSLTLYRFKE